LNVKDYSALLEEESALIYKLESHSEDWILNEDRKCWIYRSILMREEGLGMRN
jgi:hypothetical protein